MIDYPNDRNIAAAASRHGIPEPVLVRDLVRVVEVLNLKSQDFFSKRSVLAGSMALRCFDSPRFTVYDADFSTSSDTVNPATAMKAKLAYADDELEDHPRRPRPLRRTRHRVEVSARSVRARLHIADS